MYDPINWDQTVQDSGRVGHLVHSSDWFGTNPGANTTGFTVTETYTVMKPAGAGYAKGNEFSTLSLHVTGVGGTVPFQFFGALTETGANASGEIKLTGPGVNVTHNTTKTWDQTVNLSNGDYFLTISVNVAVDTTPAATKSVSLAVTLQQGAACPGDINHDGTVNGADLGLLLGNWGAY
ncbi:MAG: hypothetical protein U0575_06590 [Phycisphaerales bacterium]